MKKIISSTLSLLLLMSILATSFVSAKASQVQPLYTGISSLSSTLSLSNSSAVCNGKVFLNPGYTADLTVELKRDGTTIKTWTASGNGIVSAGGTYYVTSNHEYLVTTSAIIYNTNGTIVESPSKDSPITLY